MTNPISRSKNGSKTFAFNVVDIADFNERVVGAYNNGTAEKGLQADDQSARSVIPAATGALRDFSYIAPDIPRVHRRKLRRLHGLRHAVPGYGDPGQSGRALDARGTAGQDRRRGTAREHGRSSGRSPTSTTPCSRRRAWAAASSASSSTPPSARAAPNAWMPAAITMP